MESGNLVITVTNEWASDFWTTAEGITEQLLSNRQVRMETYNWFGGLTYPYVVGDLGRSVKFALAKNRSTHEGYVFANLRDSNVL